MKQNDVLHKHNELLKYLNHLPRKIVQLHNDEEYLEHISEFVLHDFCHESCFNLTKAAYFVDNPDFDCFKGVAGVSDETEYRKEIYNDVWQEPDKYCHYIETSPFYKKVRSIEGKSVNGHDNQKEMLDQIVSDLEVINPYLFSWPMKYGNYGFLVIERNRDTDDLLEEHLPQCAYLLSFCPIC
jgi:hypothetical protein